MVRYRSFRIFQWNIDKGMASILIFQKVSLDIIIFQKFSWRKDSIYCSMIISKIRMEDGRYRRIIKYGFDFNI